MAIPTHDSFRRRCESGPEIYRSARRRSARREKEREVNVQQATSFHVAKLALFNRATGEEDRGHRGSDRHPTLGGHTRIFCCFWRGTKPQCAAVLDTTALRKGSRVEDEAAESRRRTPSTDKRCESRCRSAGRGEYLGGRRVGRSMHPKAGYSRSYNGTSVGGSAGYSSMSK